MNQFQQRSRTSDAPVLLREGINNHEDRWSEHGLGHLRNPTDVESEDRDWISQVWLSIITRALHLPKLQLEFEHLPALGRVTITSPAGMGPLAELNVGRKYSEQVKPFNFLLKCHVKPFGHPPDTDPERFHLIAPYESHPKKWLKMPWMDQYTGKHYRIITEGFHGNRIAARVKAYGDVIREYEVHPGFKSADHHGKPCGKLTTGLLKRCHVRIERIIYIGKESNRLEEVESGSNSSGPECLDKISRPMPRRVAEQNSAHTEENPDSSPNEGQRQIPFDAAANDGWAYSTTPEKSGTIEGYPPQTRHGLGCNC